MLLAGAFGNFIRRSHAKRIGLLPPVRTDRIRYIGNAASRGAKIVLACRDCREDAEEISLSTQYVELANRPDFQMSLHGRDDVLSRVGSWSSSSSSSSSSSAVRELSVVSLLCCDPCI